MLPDADTVGRIIAEIAAAEIMPYFEKLEHGDISEKKPGDLVTVADLAAERALTAALTGLAPGSIAVGEEAVAADPGAVGALKGDAPVWIIDPIDGTVNFASGNPVFAVMVALFMGGETVMSWIYDPVKQLMATAGRGEGAWQDGRRLAVAHSAGPSGARLGDRSLARRLPQSSRFIEIVFDYRCAGQEYIALASGAAQCAYYNRLNPWDHAPGYLLHREAGGFGARLDRSPYDPREAGFGLMLAPDEASWTALREVLVVKF
jgi:fructose-1,6-bisphosphatase/inositol monophosphatase family enzyme